MKPSAPRLIERIRYAIAPDDRTLVWSSAAYTQATGGAMIRTTTHQTRSDTCDACVFDFSNDHGRTWSGAQTLATAVPDPRGTLRRHPRSGLADPFSDRTIGFMTEGILPGDNPLEGMKNWALRYSVSRDGGRRLIVDEPLIQAGDYTAEHPLDGVWIGRNGVMIGDKTCCPIATADGRILMPVQISPIGPDGEYWNPGGGYTYHETAVLIGTWAAGDRLRWNVSERVAIDPARSTRGALEPTLAAFPDGRILMVMRGSNGGRHDPDCRLPGVKWMSVSTDNGHSWTPATPWTYDSGESFFSPSSCSQLVNHSNGSIYWIGNLTPENPRGNLPRYPIVIGVVDPESLRLVKTSVTVIDDRRPDETGKLFLSNFYAGEDRPTGEIRLYMSRPFARDETKWGSDAYYYRITV